MPGRPWNEDSRADLARIRANAAALITSIAADAHDWTTLPDADRARDWHARLYAGCQVPVPGYVGHFRGDPAVKELVGYEIGIGRRRRDGLPEKLGVFSKDLAAEIPRLITQIQAGITQLDSALNPGLRPVTNDAVEAVVLLTARVHGEWIRLHPFANGNGRTARVWANFIALRYSLPAFVVVKPRPEGNAYARAGQSAMGRPPDFVGDHRPITAVFARMLTQKLSG